MSIWHGEKNPRRSSLPRTFQKFDQNNLVRLIGRGLSSVLADSTLGIGVIADCFHIAGNTPSCKDTLKI